MSTPENPPAFPIPILPGENWIESKYGSPNGMTIRDRFAGQALAGIYGKAVFDQNAENMLRKAGLKTPKEFEQLFATMAYDIADVMLAERAKVQPTEE